MALRSNNLDLTTFAKTLGTDSSEIADAYRRANSNFTYTKLSDKERDEVVLKVLKTIDSGELTPTGDKKRWIKGWGENLAEFERTNDLKSLTPKYIRPNQPVRLFGEFVMPEMASFEAEWYGIFRTWLFRKYLDTFDCIYEFGCGSGFNLAFLAQMYPEKELYGADWAKPSVDIVNRLGKIFQGRITGRIFDFFNPDYKFKIKPKSAVFTIGALEQTGQKYGKFIDYLLRMKPELVVNVEPMCEWYDETNLVDYLGLLFMRRRNYWQNASLLLRRLATEGRTEIIKMHRSHFGSLYIEGYSQMIWKPL